MEEEVLGRAMREGWIAGAALNAVPEQPLSESSQLWDLSNVIMTPRLGSSGDKWTRLSGSLGITLNVLIRGNR